MSTIVQNDSEKQLPSGLGNDPCHQMMISDTSSLLVGYQNYNRTYLGNKFRSKKKFPSPGNPSEDDFTHPSLPKATICCFYLCMYVRGCRLFVSYVASSVCYKTDRKIENFVEQPTVSCLCSACKQDILCTSHLSSSSNRQTRL